MNLLYVPIFIWGLLFGSFLNVIIYRLPRNLSIVFPNSFCPKCKKPIPLYRNIPLFSFIIQLGKCAECKNKISFRYPLIELFNGILWYLNFQQFDLQTAIFSSIISSCILAIIVIDFENFIIPINIILFGLIILGLEIGLNPVLWTKSFYGMLIGVGYLGIVFLITSLLMKKQAMGYGDLILIGLLGIWLGPIKVLYTIFIGALLGLIFYFIMNHHSNKQIKKLPFGTFLGFSSLINHFIDLSNFTKYIIQN